MRKIIGFFAGVVIFVLVLAIMSAALRIYNYADKSRIDSVLMQPAALWQNRIEAPAALDRMPDDYIRNILIQKFALEYLAVLPDADEPAMRASSNGALRMMSSAKVLSEWRRLELPKLEKMAAEKKYKTIWVDMRGIKMQGDYFVVPFAEKMWDRANDLSAAPTVARGRELYLKLRFNKKVRETLQGRNFDAGKYLDQNADPSLIFEFMVDDAVIK